MILWWSLIARAGDAEALPPEFVALLEKYGVRAIDGGPLRSGATVRIEGQVTLLSLDLRDLSPEGRRRQAVSDPRGIGIERYGALLAVCEAPRKELAALADQRVVVTGVMSCEANGRPCDADTPGWLSDLGFYSKATIAVIPHCTWTVAPVALPPGSAAALVAAGMRATTGDPEALAVGTPVVARGIATSSWGSRWVAVGGVDGPRVLCDADSDVWSSEEEDQPVEVSGVLGCVPGHGQECSATGELVSPYVRFIRRRGRVAAVPRIEGCTLTVTRAGR